MSSKKNTESYIAKSGDALTADMIGIGMLFSGDGSKCPNIEETIFSASIEATMNKDYRVRALLVDWWGIYYQSVNIDRLTSLVNYITHKEVKRFWCALAQWKKADPRLTRLSSLLSDQKDLDSGTEFRIQKYGEDPRFQNTCLRVASNEIRSRPKKDILSPANLAKIHMVYRYRLIIGPTPRADMWAKLEMEKRKKSDISGAELARFARSNRATACRVKREWSIINNIAA